MSESFNNGAITWSALWPIIRLFFSDRFDKFKSLLQTAFSKAHVQSLPFVDAKKAVNKDAKGDKFTDQEIRGALSAMQDANQLMVSDDVIFLV